MLYIRNGCVSWKIDSLAHSIVNILLPHRLHLDMSPGRKELGLLQKGLDRKAGTRNERRSACGSNGKNLSMLMTVMMLTKFKRYLLHTRSNQMCHVKGFATVVRNVGCLEQIGESHDAQSEPLVGVTDRFCEGAQVEMLTTLF